MNTLLLRFHAVLQFLSLEVTVNAQWSPPLERLAFDAGEMPKNTQWFPATRDLGPNSVLSPDSNWILRSEGGASRGEELLLYHRDAELNYTRVGNFDLGNQAETLALKQPGLPKDMRLDHRYLSFMIWSSDSRAFLFMMSGHDSGKNLYIPSGWFGIYDLAKRTISFDFSEYRFDLSKNNRRTFSTGRK